MFVKSCTFAIHFPPNTKIREQLFNLENHFADFQKPFTLVPLPQDAPLEIPRIIAVSLHGHSKLTICGNNAQLVTNFDDEYKKDIKKCVEYIRLKCNSIVSAISIINGNSDSDEKPKFYYSGISMALAMDEEDGIENPVEYITEKFLKCETNLHTDEVQFRIAFNVDAKYYVNILLQNNRLFNGRPDERGSIAGLKVAKDNLQVVLDINDRYAFNHEKDYISSVETVNAVATLAEQFATEYVRDFVLKGEIAYGNK